MCENQIECPATNNCEVVNASEGVTMTSAPILDDSKNVYISGLLSDIKTLENDLKNATDNQNRFQELYMTCLAAVYTCLQSNSIDNLKDVIPKLGEIEEKYCKA